MNIHIFSLFIIFFICTISYGAEQKVVTNWQYSAEKIYETGFMQGLMKIPAGGIGLFNMELIENDSPGAGWSEKGVFTDNIWGKFRARKILYLDDPRTEKAWVIVFPFERSAKYPLKFSVNGNESSIENWDKSKNIQLIRWSEFPAKWLKKGENVIDLYCHEAQNEKEGWVIFISRADEFENGGGNPVNVGKTSFKSTDNGKSWKQSPFGTEQTDKAEYAVRISLDRHIKTGWLASPVIDLWKGDSAQTIVPLREIQKMHLTIESQVPDGTNVEYFFRRGIEQDPNGETWDEYKPIGKGANLVYEITGMDLNRRFVQFKAVLTTDNPLITPVIKSASVEAELLERQQLAKNISIVESENPVILYPSVQWEWEKSDRPEFKELIDRENLDEVIAGSRTQLEAQVKLMDHVAKRWRHSDVFPEFPAWDALSILNRADYAGAGGYCLTFNSLLGGMCMGYGWQARIVNCDVHEVIEVWNDDYGKWIFFDADYVNHYNYDPETCEPLNMLELHNKFLDFYYPTGQIDWLKDDLDPWNDKSWIVSGKGKNYPVKRGSLTNQPGVFMTGFLNSSFLRMIPRNNWFEKPFPRPLSHGAGSNMPWDGYMEWHDSRTPPHRNHSWQTDRVQDMWPELNKVHIDAVQGYGNDRLFLRFNTYTPNFSHYEVNVDDTGWKTVGDHWAWILQSGRNNLLVRAVNGSGVKGKPSKIVLNHMDAPFTEFE